MNEKFLDNFISDRIRIIKDDKDPIHVYEILQKHFNQSIEELKEIYSIELDIIKTRIFIKADQNKLCELFNYLQSRGLTFEAVEMDQLRVDLDHFFNKIF